MVLETRYQEGPYDVTYWIAIFKDEAHNKPFSFSITREGYQSQYSTKIFETEGEALNEALRLLRSKSLNFFPTESHCLRCSSLIEEGVNAVFHNQAYCIPCGGPR